jgi:hypothetical protein
MAGGGRDLCPRPRLFLGNAKVPGTKFPDKFLSKFPVEVSLDKKIEGIIISSKQL